MLVILTNTCCLGRHQANQRASQKKPYAKSWTRPASDRAPSFISISSADKIGRHAYELEAPDVRHTHDLEAAKVPQTYELEAPDNRNAEAIHPARERIRNVEHSSIGRPPSMGKWILTPDPADHVAS
jgi:hypothetical protein